MSYDNILFDEDDYIGNPLVCPARVDDGTLEGTFDTYYTSCKLGLWNAVHKSTIFSDISLYKIIEEKMPFSVRVKRLLQPKIKYGYMISTDIDTLLDEEFVTPINVSEMGFPDTILKEIEGTSLATADVYKFTSKKVPGIEIIGKKFIGGGGASLREQDNFQAHNGLIQVS